MITFDIVRVNKSNYINRYYINIAFSYTEKIIHSYSLNTKIDNEKTALTKQYKGYRTKSVAISVPKIGK